MLFRSVIKRMSDIAMAEPGVAHAIAFPGLSINGFTNSSNAGIVFVTLKDFEERKSPALSGGAIAMSLNQKFGATQDAFIAMLQPPPANTPLTASLSAPSNFNLIRNGAIRQ